MEVIMRCFVAREYSVSTEVICSIDKVLEELSIERIDAFSVEPGENVGTSLRSMILESDFIIAILSSTSSDVLFEVGLAVGSNKSVFLLAEENMVLPFNLKGMAYIRINDKLSENLLLPLRYFIQGLQNKKSLEVVTPKYIKSEVEEKQFFEKLQDIKTKGNGTQFERFVIDFFEQIKEQYTTIKVAEHSRDLSYDLALWIDELEGLIYNPILFDLKFGKINQNRMDEIAERAAANNGQMIIVLYCDTSNTAFSCTSKYPGILIVSFEKFMQAVFKYGLPKAVLLLRNSAAHGMELQV